MVVKVNRSRRAMSVWEQIERTAPNAEPATRTDRMAVPGGTIYRTMAFGWGTKGHTQPPNVALVFVPDRIPPGAAGGGGGGGGSRS
jgi:hypothetical protein